MRIDFEPATFISAVVDTVPPLHFEAGVGQEVTESTHGCKLQLDDDGLAGTFSIEDVHSGTLRMVVRLPNNPCTVDQVELTSGKYVDVTLCLKDEEHLIYRTD